MKRICRLLQWYWKIPFWVLIASFLFGASGSTLSSRTNIEWHLSILKRRQKRAGGNAQPFAAMEHVLVLPLTWRELMVLVRAGVGHSDSERAGREVGFAQIRVDFSRMEVSRADRPVALTALEFKALAFLVQNPERVISRDELLHEVWGYDNYPCTRTVDNHILKLRQKLERDPSHPVHFLTVHRVGYKFVP